MTDQSHFTEKAAARIMNLHPQTLAKWRKNGSIGYHKTPTGRIFYTADQLASCRAEMRIDPAKV